MSKPYRFKKMLEPVKKALEKIPEHRTGKNKQYELKDAGLSALSLFYMQSPSFLSWQRDMEKKKGKNNARNLFEIGRISSDEQIKNLLDPVSEKIIDTYRLSWAGGKGCVGEVQACSRKLFGEFGRDATA